jgi:hypothetical protein
MAEPVNYKGYVINPTPYPYSDPERHSVRAVIARHDGQCVHERPYDSGGFREDKDDAERAAIEFAKKVIDGKVVGLSVADL